LSLYFGLALRTFTPITLWVFERYYAELKGEFPSDSPYLAGTILQPDGSDLKTTNLVIELKKTHPGSRFWIYGGSGTGKTALTRELMKQLSEFANLRQAWRNYPCIPIFVPLRDFPKGSGLDVIAKVLDACSMPLDLKLLEALLKTGKFLVIFDGLNEISTDREILEFASIYKPVSIVVTSQLRSTNGAFRQYRLPSVTGEVAKQLLRTFLGPTDATSQGDKSLWESVESAYDVRLIADLIAKKASIPETRIALYGAIVDSAETFGLNVAGQGALFRLAWTMWLGGQYRFVPASELTTEAVNALLAANIAVPRGDHFEFRHDLMRGYLAARWLSHDVLSAQTMRSRLSETKIWELASVEQKAVFPFFVAQLPDHKSLQEAFFISLENPEIRRELMLASIQESKRRGLRWSLNGLAASAGES
jgi:hypothetical protein